MERVIRMPHKRHNFVRKFVELVSLKVPSGSSSWTVLTVPVDEDGVQPLDLEELRLCRRGR